MATLKELKDKILLAVYRRYKDGTFSPTNALTFCRQNNIIFNSNQELVFAFKGLKENGYLNITFVIGGSYGLSNNIKNRSNYKLSFSNMTFPHGLFRLIFLEQLYRCFKIINNETYHK